MRGDDDRADALCLKTPRDVFAATSATPGVLVEAVVDGAGEEQPATWYPADGIGLAPFIQPGVVRRFPAQAVGLAEDGVVEGLQEVRLLFGLLVLGGDRCPVKPADWRQQPGQGVTPNSRIAFHCRAPLPARQHPGFLVVLDELITVDALVLNLFRATLGPDQARELQNLWLLAVRTRQPEMALVGLLEGDVEALPQVRPFPDVPVAQIALP